MINKITEISDPAHKRRYGCVFCITGREQSVAESMEAQNPGVKATFVSQTKWHTRQGISNKVTQLILPGYVFFQTIVDNPPDLRYIEDSIRLLETTRHSWSLAGMDEWFAKWVFDNHGVIGFSKAIKVDEWVEYMNTIKQHINQLCA